MFNKNHYDGAPQGFSWKSAHHILEQPGFNSGSGHVMKITKFSVCLHCIYSKKLPPTLPKKIIFKK